MAEKVIGAILDSRIPPSENEQTTRYLVKWLDGSSSWEDESVLLKQYGKELISDFCNKRDMSKQSQFVKIDSAHNLLLSISSDDEGSSRSPSPSPPGSSSPVLSQQMPPQPDDTADNVQQSYFSFEGLLAQSSGSCLTPFLCNLSVSDRHPFIYYAIRMLNNDQLSSIALYRTSSNSTPFLSEMESWCQTAMQQNDIAFIQDLFFFVEIMPLPQSSSYTKFSNFLSQVQSHQELGVIAARILGKWKPSIPSKLFNASTANISVKPATHEEKPPEIIRVPPPSKLTSPALTSTAEPVNQPRNVIEVPLSVATSPDHKLRNRSPEISRTLPTRGPNPTPREATESDRRSSPGTKSNPSRYQATVKTTAPDNNTRRSVYQESGTQSSNGRSGGQSGSYSQPGSKSGDYRNRDTRESSKKFPHAVPRFSAPLPASAHGDYDNQRSGPQRNGATSNRSQKYVSSGGDRFDTRASNQTERPRDQPPIHPDRQVHRQQSTATARGQEFYQNNRDSYHDSFPSDQSGRQKYRPNAVANPSDRNSYQEPGNLRSNRRDYSHNSSSNTPNRQIIGQGYQPSSAQKSTDYGRQAYEDGSSVRHQRSNVDPARAVDSRSRASTDSRNNASYDKSNGLPSGIGRGRSINTDASYKFRSNPSITEFPVAHDFSRSQKQRPDFSDESHDRMRPHGRSSDDSRKDSSNDFSNRALSNKRRPDDNWSSSYSGPNKAVRLSEDERRDLIERGACLYCRKPGHSIDNCKTRPARS
uniref:Chromo domain-containing protein n=1 Tax=Spongospora subterranea TaxID=70186 RepID=A0A0H5RKW0_9EUKA|eukprot:CRZ09354.1 hypothetical protein [Spongospora subterranea]